jgi:hypothetical protein
MKFSSPMTSLISPLGKHDLNKAVAMGVTTVSETSFRLWEANRIFIDYE